MKRIYMSAIFACLGSMAFSQSFFVPTDYRGAFAPAPTAMWTDGWANWDPQNTVYPASTVNVSTAITNNTTWTANQTYLLQGQIYVKNGATLTIEPGTKILGDKATPGSGLFITQGSKLIANGTAANPIVFTSNQAAGARAAGDWGGIILLGRASLNNPSGTGNVEGIAPIPDTQYGGGATPNDNDNSGSMQYVRIEFPGYVYQPDSEINGLTLGAVGRATTLNHIQVSFCNDDAYEWFGGTVNAHHIVSYRNVDDDFDTDRGFTGNIQFGLIIRDPQIADIASGAASEGFESDNDASGTGATPQTAAIFSNITAIGPFRGNTGASIVSTYRRGARLRRNTALKIYNSIFMDYPRGIHIDGFETNASTPLPLGANGPLRYMNNIVAGNTPGRVTEKNAGSTFNIIGWFDANNNDSIASTAGILVTPYDYLAPDYRPAGASPLLTGALFNDNLIATFVLAAPAASDVEYCVGATASALTATATAGNTLYWYDVATGGTGSTTAPVPTTTAAGSFQYYVAQRNAEGTEGPRTLVTVTVNALPATPVITADGSTTFCTGGTVELSAPAATSYEWSNTAATTQAIDVTTSGTYTVTVTNADGCEATSAPVTVNVSNAPVPTIQTSGATAICDGSEVTLTASEADSYLWSNNATTQFITVDAAGSYTVTTTNADACDGVGQSAPVVVTVNTQPVANGTVASTNGYVVTFSNTSTQATSYSWDFGDDSNSSATAPTHAYTTSDMYEVTLIAINGNCTDTATIMVGITVGVEEISSVNSVIVFPNPASDKATLAIELANDALVEVVIMNANGQIVQNVANGQMTAGVNEVTIDASDLTQGLYFAVVKAADAQKVIRFSVAK